MITPLHISPVRFGNNKDLDRLQQLKVEAEEKARQAEERARQAEKRAKAEAAAEAAQKFRKDQQAFVDNRLFTLQVEGEQIEVTGAMLLQMLQKPITLKVDIRESDRSHEDFAKELFDHYFGKIPAFQFTFLPSPPPRRLIPSKQFSRLDLKRLNRHPANVNKQIKSELQYAIERAVRLKLLDLNITGVVARNFHGFPVIIKEECKLTDAGKKALQGASREGLYNGYKFQLPTGAMSSPRES